MSETPTPPTPDTNIETREAPHDEFALLCQEVERAIREYITRLTPFDGPRPLANAQFRGYGLLGMWGIHTEAPVKGEQHFRLRLEIMPTYGVTVYDEEGA